MYQTGELTETQVKLIREGLRILLDIREGQEGEDPDLGCLREMVKDFEDPDNRLIVLD